MARFQFELATAGDDAELRGILAATPMPGHVSVSYRREPSFFASTPVGGDFQQVLVARDREAGRVAAFVSRAVRLMYVNGEPEPVGFLGGVRALPEYRNTGVVARGIMQLRRLHDDGRARLYLATIAEGNETALKILTSGRTSLPTMHPAGRYIAWALPISTRRSRLAKVATGIELHEAARNDLSEIVDFLIEHGPRRQFFPVYREEDFFEADCTFKDLRPNDILLARRDGRLVGMLAAWDQHGFKQSIVEGYGRMLRVAAPAINLWARAVGKPPIPRPGEELRYLSAALPIAAGDDPQVFAALVQGVLKRAAGGLHQYLMLGMHERDPLAAVARRIGGRTYVGHFYTACWDDGEALRQTLDNRPPYLELGCM
jgi:hypothetical protein